MMRDKILYESDGWSFVQEYYSYGNYFFVSHNKCKGAENYFGVMHYKDHICQSCGEIPPVNMLGAYMIHLWGNSSYQPRVNDEV